jgi:hypothetical protein
MEFRISLRSSTPKARLQISLGRSPRNTAKMQYALKARLNKPWPLSLGRAFSANCLLIGFLGLRPRLA